MADDHDRSKALRLRSRLDTVRIRTTLGAVVVVAIVLLLASVAMVVLLRNTLTDDVRTVAAFRAEAVASLLGSEIPDPLPVGDLEDEYVQVLDERGDVVAASTNAGSERIVNDPDPDASIRHEVPFEDEAFLSVATVRQVGGVSYTVVAGRTLEVVEESTRVVATLLLFGSPLLLMVVGSTTWWVVGRALRPVEVIRNEVTAISTSRLDRRVPEPEARDEIGRLARTMNDMLERLERGQVLQRRFVSDASHELRSPVASIRQHAEVTLAHPGTTSAEELAEVVLDEDLRIQRLVEDLLLLTRLDEHAPLGRRVPTDVDDIVLAEAARISAASDHAIDTSEVSAGRVIGDPSQIARVVGNLLDNAARHARSKVAVSLRESQEDVILRVDDDGEGIPSEERTRVFERFVRLQEARDRDSGGVGLGLAIVAEVTAAHGGRVEISGSSLGGARFEVRLPRSAN